MSEASGVIPVQRVQPGEDPHLVAVRRAYELVEAVQDRDVTVQIEQLAEEAEAAGWADVGLLMHMARSLASRTVGLNAAEHVQAMLATAADLDDPALSALALASSAQRTADLRQVAVSGSGASEQLVQAVVLLERTDSLVVHRIAAHIEVAGVFYLLGLWTLSKEQYELVTALLQDEPDHAWVDVLRRQHRVVVFNTIDLDLDQACALAEIGDWAGARDLSRAAVPASLGFLDGDWPGSWTATLHAFSEVLAALAGQQSPADREYLGVQGGKRDVIAAIVTVAEAVRARDAGDLARSVQLAHGCSDVIAVAPEVPEHLRLLTFSLAAHGPGTPLPALAYIRELVTLRWNSLLSRLSAMTTAIEVERQRVEHQRLREQVLVDELTGLGNRRAYTAHLETLRRAAVEAMTDSRVDGPGDPEVVVMMLDVDHFKAVNDEYGHDVGDEVLRRIGALLLAQVRSSDLAARLGGDEFVVILTQHGEGPRDTRAEAIVASVSEHAWDEVAPGLKVTVSLGLHHGPAGDLARLLGEADRQLYVAKRGGRGRVSGSRNEPLHPGP